MVKEDGYSTLLLGVRSLQLRKPHTMVEEDSHLTPLVGAKEFRIAKTTPCPAYGTTYTERVDDFSSYHLVERISMNEGLRRTRIK